MAVRQRNSSRFDLDSSPNSAVAVGSVGPAIACLRIQTLHFAILLYARNYSTVVQYSTISSFKLNALHFYFFFTIFELEVIESSILFHQQLFTTS